MTTIQATDTQPTATYDVGTQTINLTVMVSPGADPSNPDIVAAPVSVPKGDWTLFWNLQSEGGTATFLDVALPENPLPSGNVTVSDSALANPLQWTAKIRNQVTGFNGFNYDITVDWHQNPITNGLSFEVVIKDPTIAVTSDPLG